MAERSVRASVRLRWLLAVVACLVTGTAVTLGFAADADLPGESAAALPAGLLAGWIALAAVDTAWALVQVWRMDDAQTRAHATAEDPGHKVARLVAILGSVVSLAAVVVVIVQARHASGATVPVLAGLALLSVVASWTLIQVNYMLHYARVYYEAGPDGEPKGGIDFNQDEDPAYSDFAYFSVGLGMTYQVADTNVTRGPVRRIVIAQTLLAYLFGAGILAVAINLVAGLG